jgi:hypothetical protein
MGTGNIFRLKSNYPASKVLITTTAGTKTLNTTTAQNVTIDSVIQDFASAVFFTSVVSNTSAAPKLYLDASYDGVTYTQYATLHSDFTTTANTKVVGVSPLPMFSKIRFKNATTATACKVQVRVCLRP